MSDYEYIDTDGDKIEVMERHACNQGEVYICTPDHGATIKPEDAPAVALAILEAAGYAAGGCAYADDAVLLLRDEIEDQAGRKERAERAEREAEDAKVRAWLLKTHGPGLGQCITDADRTEYRLNRDFFQQEDDANTVQALRDLGICHHEADLPTPGFVADFVAHAHAELAQPATIDDAEDIGPSHHRREWVDQDGLIWSYDYKAGNWGYRTKHGKSRTVDIPDSFPWTEKTKDPEPRVLNYGDPEPDRDTKWRDSEGGVVRYFPRDAGWGNTCGRVWEGLGNHWFPMTEVTDS